MLPVIESGLAIILYAARAATSPIETTMGLSIFFIEATISSAAAGEPPGLFILITIAFTPSSSEASLRLFVISSDVAIPNPAGMLPVSIIPCTYITSTLFAEIPKSFPPKIMYRLPAIIIKRKKTTAKYNTSLLEFVIVKQCEYDTKYLPVIVLYTHVKISCVACFDKLVAHLLRVTVVDN